MKNILTKILLVIFIAIFLFSGYQLLKIFLEYHAGTTEYDQAANQYVKEKEDSENKSQSSIAGLALVNIAFIMEFINKIQLRSRAFHYWESIDSCHKEC